MAFSNTILNAALDNEFYRSGSATTMRLYSDTNTLLDSETVYFSQASGGATQVTSVVFAVTAGSTVARIDLYASDVFESEPVEEETFTTNGTYTVNLFRKALI